MNAPQRAALVTGASRGVGRAIAAALARDGYSVALVARGRDELAAVADEIRAEGGNALDVVADVGDEAMVTAAFDAAAQAFGGLDVAVLNAAIERGGPVEACSLADWQATLDTNLTGPFLCARAAIPLLRARGGGSIIAIGSGAARQGYAGLAAYSASKFGLLGLMQSLAAEVGDEGIKVSTILPGSILTTFGGGTGARKPGRKYLLPEDVAEAVLALLRQAPQAWTQEMNLWPFR